MNQQKMKNHYKWAHPSIAPASLKYPCCRTAGCMARLLSRSKGVNFSRTFCITRVMLLDEHRGLHHFTTSSLGDLTQRLYGATQSAFNRQTTTYFNVSCTAPETTATAPRGASAHPSINSPNESTRRNYCGAWINKFSKFG